MNKLHHTTLVAILALTLTACTSMGNPDSSETDTTPPATSYDQPIDSTTYSTAITELFGDTFTITYPDGSSTSTSNSSFATSTLPDGTTSDDQSVSYQGDGLIKIEDNVHSLMLGGIDYPDMRYGAWNSDNAFYGGAFVVGSPSTELSGEGTYKYSGHSIVITPYTTTPSIGDFSANVDMTNKKISLIVTGFDYANNSIAANDLDITGTSFSGKLCNAGAYSCTGEIETGMVRGGFFGSQANRIGGTFKAKNVVEGGTFFGSFGGTR